MNSIRGWQCLVLFLAAACSRSGVLDDDFGGFGTGAVTNTGGAAGASGSGGEGAGGNGGFAGFGGFGDVSGGGTGGFAGAGGSGGSAGVAGACGADADCTTNDACHVGKCVPGGCVTLLRDADGDGHIDAACGGDDCNDENPNAHPGLPEVCGDGADNDCNGLTDCLDPACAGVVPCACVPKSPTELCGEGIDADCDGLVDCNDPDCIGTGPCGCAASEFGNCQNGIDDDCNGLTDCADPACVMDAGCICQSTPENCTNGVDDDCDLLVDCADPDCKGTAACVCTTPPTAENCSNGRDDDCDGAIDCADTDCASSPDCAKCAPENCSNGVDDDCDGAIDCADSDCRFSPNCKPVAEICNNGIDDDHDGKIDCQDPDCANNPTCAKKQSNCLTARLITASGSYTGDTTGNVGETTGTCGGAAGEAVFRLALTAPSEVSLDTIGSNFDTTLYVRVGSCTAGRELGCDDDSGGVDHASKLAFDTLPTGNYFVYVDGFAVDANRGPDQGTYVLNVTIDQNPKEICNDGKDNDGDHFADCADPDCASAPNCLNCNNGAPPVAEFGVANCTDGIDNDCDGKIDCADSDCHASEAYPTECCNGLDDNGNGIIDDFACRCADDTTCESGLCYTDTVSACGDPCENFFGDICPFAAPGSTCSTVTNQCEF